MFVFSDAKEKILFKRKNQVLKHLIEEVVLESQRLQVSDEELILMIKSEQSRREK